MRAILSRARSFLMSDLPSLVRLVSTGEIVLAFWVDLDSGKDREVLQKRPKSRLNFAFLYPNGFWISQSNGGHEDCCHLQNMLPKNRESVPMPLVPESKLSPSLPRSANSSETLWWILSQIACQFVYNRVNWPSGTSKPCMFRSL